MELAIAGKQLFEKVGYQIPSGGRSKVSNPVASLKVVASLRKAVPFFFRIHSSHLSSKQIVNHSHGLESDPRIGWDFTRK